MHFEPMRPAKPSRILALAMGLLAAPFALAQQYPNKPIRLLVGYPPGGNNDIAARQLAPKLGETLGAAMVVENVAGANGILAQDMVAKAAPDGHVLGFAGLTSLVLNSLTYAKLPYDPSRDFAGITEVASSPILFAMRPELGINSIADLVAQARARPGQIRFITIGTGGSTRVIFELLKSAANIDIGYVPYTGIAQALPNLFGGLVEGVGIDFPVVYPHVQAGKLRAIFVTSEKRNPRLPDVRTAAEQGMPALTAGNWFALIAPAKAPKPVVAKIHAGTAAVMKSPELRDRLLSLGMDPAVSASPEAFTAFVDSELARWGKIVKSAGITAEQ